MKMLPPQNIDAEKSVLGSILVDSSVKYDVINLIKPDDFYRNDHELIFSAMCQLFNQNIPIDVITVSEKLTTTDDLDKAGGLQYLISLTEDVAIVSNAVQYVNIILNKSIQRKLIKAAGDIAKNSYQSLDDVSGLLESSEQAIFNISQNKSSKSYVKIGDALASVYEDISVTASSGQLPGIMTGFYDLDKLLLGFQNSDLVLIAARPGMGKTAIMLNIAQYAAVKNNIPVAIFNLEMSANQLIKRMISSDTRIESEKLRGGKQFLEEDWVKLGNVFNTLGNAPIYFDDSTDVTISGIRAKCRKLKVEKDIQMVFIDYLQLMQSGSKTDNRTTEVSDISRGLKLLARELNVPVIVGSQLSREVEKRGDKRPMLSDLRESGAIEQDADVVLFLYRDDYYNKESEFKNVAEVIVGKHRNGSTGTVNLAFEGETMTFRNISYAK